MFVVYKKPSGSVHKTNFPSNFPLKLIYSLNILLCSISKGIRVQFHFFFFTFYFTLLISIFFLCQFPNLIWL